MSNKTTAAEIKNSLEALDISVPVSHQTPKAEAAEIRSNLRELGSTAVVSVN